jgi:hypothetical protein
MAEHVTFREGTARVLQTEAGRGAAQVTERFNADVSLYLAGDDAPTGWAMVTYNHRRYRQSCAPASLARRRARPVAHGLPVIGKTAKVR